MEKLPGQMMKVLFYGNPYATICIPRQYSAIGLVHCRNDDIQMQCSAP